MDKVALAITLFLALAGGLFAFLKDCFGNQPWGSAGFNAFGYKSMNID